jgi:dTDP-4-dehydrorhamnose 3,5-epimerase
MLFHPNAVTGSYVIEPQKRGDERGFFARLFCTGEFTDHGLETRIVQANASLSAAKGTLRGMHYQLGAAAEVKLVRCTAGAVFDVALDLRPDSPTFGKWFGTELSAKNHAMLYVPRGCAHGFITLTGDAEVFYLVSAPYSPTQERCVRYNDPRFAVAWPAEPQVVSAKDAASPDFDPGHHGTEMLRGLL